MSPRATSISTLLNQATPQAFPSLSTGIYGYPIDDATHIALDATRLFLDTPDGDKVAGREFFDGPEGLTYYARWTVPSSSFGATKTEMSTGL